MVEVFKTNVLSVIEASRIVHLLKEKFPMGSINFDLEDCDRILRVEDEQVCADTAIAVLRGLGYFCEVLAD